MTQAQSYEAWRITYQSDEQAARSAFDTAEMLRQELLVARTAITSLERDVSQALTERDDATDFIDKILDEVLGQDRHEWTSAYDWDDALADVEAKMAALKSGKCLHQIAEPAAPVVKPIKDAIDALVMAAFTEGGCSEHRMSEARIQTELRKKELRTLLSTPQPCSRSHPHEEMTPMCELRTEIARLTNALARAEAQLAAAPQAVQPAVPDGWTAVHFGGKRNGKISTTCDTEKECNDYIEMVHQQSDSTTLTAKPVFFAAAPAHPAEGVPAQAVQITLTGYQLLAALRLANPSLDFAPMELLTDIVLSDTPLVDFDGAQLHEGPIAWVDGVNESAIALEAEPENGLRAATQPAAQGLDAKAMSEWLLARRSHLGSSRESAHWGEKCWDNYTMLSEYFAAQAKQGGA